MPVLDRLNRVHTNLPRRFTTGPLADETPYVDRPSKGRAKAVPDAGRQTGRNVVAAVAAAAIAVAVSLWYYAVFIPAIPGRLVQEYIDYTNRYRVRQAVEYWGTRPETAYWANAVSGTLASYRGNLAFQAESVSFYLPGEQKPANTGDTLKALRAGRAEVTGLLFIAEIPYRVVFELEDASRGTPFWWLVKTWRIERVRGLEWLKPAPETD